MSKLTELRSVVEEAVEGFPQNRLCRKVDAGDLDLSGYHKILRMIFHQVREGSASFALAGVNCSARFQAAREYFFQHADEEKSHWQWVLSDLEKTGDQETDVRLSLPLPACQSYIALNYYVAIKIPIARLAIAAVLEGIGARYGAHYARKVCQLLKLTPQQAKFYFGHGDTDVEHIADIWRTIEACELDNEELKWMCHAARMAGAGYRQMYDEALGQ